ncbi:lytic transglycosylase domain-containing protein [Maritimibacter sp. DP1N21-5]|nr:lytic transglycosylase domain-containing protein [Maritimibacter sp. DP1N21-5]
MGAVSTRDVTQEWEAANQPGAPEVAQERAQQPAEVAQPPAAALPPDGPRFVAAPPADFTFRRIAAPAAGTTGRITVQIDPDEQARLRAAARAEAEARLASLTPMAEDPVPGAAPMPFDWFWGTVSPSIEGGGPVNVARALRLLETDSQIDPPRLQHMQDIARAYGPQILMATVGTTISPALVLALISVESGGVATAESEKGAQGIMQLIPDTAARFGVADAMDPAQNIKGGVAYLDWLMGEFQGDAILSLAGYNAGEGAVGANGGVPPYAETRAYVPKVLNAWRVARGLCVTPPELLTDGCVFAVNGI